MMYFLGCDVSKAKLDVSLIDTNGQELFADKVLNTTIDIATLLMTIIGNYPRDELATVVESTGVYHYPVAEASYATGVGCRIYNPILTKQQIKATIRGKKTDRTDALMIARLGLRGEGYWYTPEPYMTTKHYARSCQKLSILGSSFRQYKNHITELLDDELTTEALDVLKDIQQSIKQARQQLYKDLAVSAKGPIFTRLQTIPGIGPYIASSIIGEIQDMSRFKTSKALIAYAGLDPKIRQSGHTLNNTGRLTKRGSSYLRRSIFIAASVARQHDPMLEAIYTHKRDEGKPYTVAICVVARKLLTIVRAVWLSGQTYNPMFTNTNSQEKV